MNRKQRMRLKERQRRARPSAIKSIPRKSIKDIFKPILETMQGKSRDVLEKEMDYASGAESPLINPDKFLEEKGKDLRFYDVMMMDDRISMVLNMKKKMVLSVNGEFVSGSQDQRDLDIRDFVERNFYNMEAGDVAKTPVRWWDVFDNLLDGMAYGHRPGELIWRMVDAKWVIKNIKFMHPIYFDYEYDDYGYIKRIVIGRDYGHERIVEAKDVNTKFIIYVNPYLKDGNYYGESDLKEIFMQYYSKYHIQRYRNMYLQNYGNPIPIVTYDKDITDDEELEAMEEMLKNFQANMFVFVPGKRDKKSGELIGKFNIDFRDAGTSKGTDGHEKAIDQIDKQITRKLLIPDKLGFSESDSGSYNLGQKQFDILMMILKDLHGRLEDTVNPMIKTMVDLNFANVESYPEWRFEKIDKRIEKEMLNMLIMNKVIDPGEKWIRQYTGVPEISEDEKRELDESRANDGEDETTPMPTGEESAGDENNGGSEGTKVVDPAEAMNGAQITALVGVIEKVASGLLPVQSATEIIQSGFPIKPERIARMLDPVKDGNGKAPKTPPVLPNGEPIMPGEKPVDDLPPRGTGRTMPGWKPGQGPRAGMKIGSNYPVNFKELDKKFNGYENDFVRDYNEIHGAESISLVKQVERKKIIENKDLAGLKKLRVKKTELKKMLSQFYAKMYLTGKVDAFDEVKSRLPDAIKAFKGEPATFQDEDEWLNREWIDGYLERRGEKLSKEDISYLRTLRERAFFITGETEERILKIVQNTISEGIRSGTVARDIISKIETNLRGDRKQYALTIARTNMADSYNTGRMNEFMSDSIRPFVDAFQYQAILDNVTTEFCRKHDGQVIKKDDPALGTINPPNHFNCRSILVSILVGEDGESGPFQNWETNKKEFPTWGTGVPVDARKPAKGFGG